MQFINKGGGTNTSDATAISDDILNSKIAYGSKGKIIGTMPDNSAIEIIPSEEEQIIPLGYHDGKGKVLPVDYNNTLKPSEYQKCLALSEQILSDEVAYMPLEYVRTDKSYNEFHTDLDLFASRNWKIDVTMEFLSFYDYQGIWHNTSANNNHQSWIDASGRQYTRYNNIKPSAIQLAINTKYNIVDEYKDGQMTTTLDGNTETARKYSCDVVYNDKLIFLKDKGSSHAKIYEIKVSKDDILVLHLKPYLNVFTENVILRDLISGKEYMANFIADI